MVSYHSNRKVINAKGMSRWKDQGIRVRVGLSTGDMLRWPRYWRSLSARLVPGAAGTNAGDRERDAREDKCPQLIAEIVVELLLLWWVARGRSGGPGGECDRSMSCPERHRRDLMRHRGGI